MQLGFSKRDQGDGQQLLARYRVLREKQKALHTALLKFIPKGALQKSARRLGIRYEQNTLLFGAQCEMDVLIDYCLYDFREASYKARRANAVERMLLVAPPPDGSDEMVLLQASARARYCIMVVEKLARGVGATVTDMFRRESFFLSDVSLSETAAIGVPLAARVITANGFNFTTGAALPLPTEATASDVVMGLKAEVGEKVLEDADGLSPQEKARMSAVIIRACLAHEASSRIIYE